MRRGRTTCRGSCRARNGRRNARMPFSPGRREYWRHPDCMRVPLIPSWEAFEEPPPPERVQVTTDFPATSSFPYLPALPAQPPAPGTLRGPLHLPFPPPPGFAMPGSYMAAVTQDTAGPLAPRAPCNRKIPTEFAKRLNQTKSDAFKKALVFGENSLQQENRSLLFKLPPELRDRIFDYCIESARYCPRCFVMHPLICRLSHNMLISGISSLPLIFTNRQIYLEVQRLIYSRVVPINLTGYSLKALRGVPDEFRQMKWTAKWPKTNSGVMRYAKKVNVALTYGRRLNREWQFKGRWYHLTLETPGHIAVYDPEWTVIPNVVNYLKSFESLSKVRISIEMYQRMVGVITGLEESDLNRLLPFQELISNGIELEIKLIMGPFSHYMDDGITDEQYPQLEQRGVFEWKEQLRGWLLKRNLQQVVTL